MNKIDVLVKEIRKIPKGKEVTITQKWCEASE